DAQDNTGSLDSAEKQVQDLVAKFQPDQAARFADYSKSFRDRATAEGISSEEQAKMFSSIEKLLQAPEDGAMIDSSRRALMAVEFMYHAADPSTIDQGDWNTCSVNTIEQRMFSKYPAKLAEMVEQVALTGQWKSTDGKMINIGDKDVMAIWEAKQHPPLNGDRTLVSQLIQVTALNDIGQRGELGGFKGKDVHYVEIGGGESVVIQEGEAAAEFKGNSAGTMQRELSRLTGETEPVILVNVDKDKGKNTGVTHFETQDQMLTELQELKDKNDFPAILSVYGNLPPFSDPGTEGGHVVSVTDIRKNPDGTVDLFIDNSWGKGETGCDGWYPLTQVFTSTRPSVPAA
ncbi:MAG: hypothetical protein K2X29_14795, partial [Candidatus Obscuribacterales bacterium]|nr:hypothetical protein [Candidatus Obscuribacterales bacterium]